VSRFTNKALTAILLLTEVYACMYVRIQIECFHFSRIDFNIYLRTLLQNLCFLRHIFIVSFQKMKMEIDKVKLT